MCVCVCVRARARVCVRARVRARAHTHKYVQVFWQTKSCVQPRGPRDEWQQMQQMPPPVVKWAQEGKAQSEMRPGKVDPKGGSSRDYRPLMTEISFED